MTRLLGRLMRAKLSALRDLFDSVLGVFDAKIVRRSGWSRLIARERYFLGVWEKMKPEEKNQVASLLPLAKSQYGQDVVVAFLYQQGCISKYFVEFGAADGVSWSNSYLLEKGLNWEGIVAEPAKCFKEMLLANRTCNIDFRCVVGNSCVGPVSFVEVGGATPKFPVSSPELSGIEKFLSKDWASPIRNQNSKTYKVDTVTLEALLEFHNAPKKIGYISIDVEGAEVDVLESFLHSDYKADFISVEHNQRPLTGETIRSLMERYRYTNILSDISEAESWYIRNECLEQVADVAWI